MASTQACVGFIDMDCFYVAVERARDPSLDGLPVAVCQYESWQKDTKTLTASDDRRVTSGGSGLIAVSYEARAAGVKRQMQAGQARKACPRLITVQVPTEHGKANMSIYKEAGQRVCDILATFADRVERSVDEVAVDVTGAARKLLETTPFDDILREALQKGSHLADSAASLEMARETHASTRAGSSKQRERSAGGGPDPSDSYDANEQTMLAGAVVVARARAAVTKQLGFTCSGGVAPNKQLAKLGCGLHKPNQQTVVLRRHVAGLLRDLPLDRLAGLGGEFGKRLKDELRVETAGDLAAKEPRDLVRAGVCEDEGDAIRVVRMARGEHDDPVKDQATYKSFAASKNFFRAPLDDEAAVDKWLRNFADELWDRVTKDREAHARAPTSCTVSVTRGGEHRFTGTVGATSATRAGALSVGWGGSPKTVYDAARACFRRWAGEKHAGGGFGITVLGVTVSNFEDLQKEGKGGGIMALFKKPSGRSPRAPPGAAAAAPWAFPARGAASRRRPTTAAARPIDVDGDDDDAPWTCAACTYEHASPAEAAYLACALCATPRTPA
ncbi:hypothetical protein JL720_15105 [Aureococcus anophagefferens]|nr:hypothetical protein JL720_15105 [Aureococcus anophagefferens]